MVMSGMEGYVLKCDQCGHEETVIINRMQEYFQIKGIRKAMKYLLGPQKPKEKPCPKCGGTMSVDPTKQILF